MFTTPNKQRIFIMGTEISIVLDDDKCNDENADGLCDGDTIYLRTSYQSREHYRRVYAHECFHALCEILGCQLDIHLEETLAHRVSYMIVHEI